MGDPFTKRATDALNGTTPGPWEFDGTKYVDGGDGLEWTVAKCGNPVDAEFIVAAPELLAEAARRCDPGDTDIDALVADLRVWAMAMPFGPTCTAAADLIDQAFGDRP